MITYKLFINCISTPFNKDPDILLRPVVSLQFDQARTGSVVVSILFVEAKTATPCWDPA
jgi:hypothetical protein